ncbi:MAG: polysaccharide biosynthesis/export family protein [Paracoccaceae bacterium]
MNLEINAEDNSLQEDFDVVEKTLTIREARKQKYAIYPRKVLRNGRGDRARPISEKLALISNFPKSEPLVEYRIGISDTILFSRLIENNRWPLKKANRWPAQRAVSNYKLGIGDIVALTLMKDDNSFEQMTPISRNNSDGSNDNQNLIISSQQNDGTIETTGRIGSDGSVLLLEVGRLEATGKSLNNLRSEVRNILIRNGVSPRFQLEIVEFKSQKAYLTVNSTSQVIILDDQRTTIRNILTSAKVGFRPGVVTRIRLQRDGEEYSILLRDIYSEDAPNIDIEPGDHIFVEDSSARIVSTSSIVDNEGSVVFEGVGKIEAAGLSLGELRTKIKTLMPQVPDSQNAFQIQITKFASQTALLSTPGKPGVIIPITNTPATLTEVLTQNTLSGAPDSITQINLQRDGETFIFTLGDLIHPSNHKVYLKSGDLITTEVLKYKENKVFILGGVAPQIFKINPANRETLADVLFTSGGALSASNAKRSEVYLLRGSNPVVAFHLDAQSPTRLIVADTMELRPSDILYVAEQPIISFNRTLATIIPLRLLLRDIQDENIP